MMKTKEYEALHEKKQHGTPLFPYNTYLCSIPLDFVQVPPHWHGDVELIVIKKGMGLILVDMRPYVVTAGDMVMVRPGQIHAIRQYGREEMEYENILFQPSLLYSESADCCTLEYLQPYFHLEFDVPCHINPDFPGYGQLAACIEGIDQLCSRRPRYYELLIKSGLFQFFYLMFSQQDHLIPAKNRDGLEKTKEMISYIEENYTHSVTVSSAAKHMGLSESHFMKRFRQNMNTTFTAYLNDYRLAMAGKLLLTTDDSVLAVAEGVGFHNLSYFNRQFKAQYHVTPREYRKNRPLN